LANSGNKPRKRQTADLAAGLAWINPGAEQRFADVYVAEAGHDPLIEQQQFHRLLAALQGVCKVLSGQAGPERLRAHRGKRGPQAEAIGWLKVDEPESPGIEQREAVAAGLDHEMVVLAECLGVDSPAAAHAEV